MFFSPAKLADRLAPIPFIEYLDRDVALAIQSHSLRHLEYSFRRFPAAVGGLEPIRPGVQIHALIHTDQPDIHLHTGIEQGDMWRFLTILLLRLYLFRLRAFLSAP